MEGDIKHNAKKRLSFGRSPDGTDALLETNNVCHRNCNYEHERGCYPRTHLKKLKPGDPDEQQRGMIDFSVTNVINSRPQKSVQQCTTSQSQELGREVTPKKELNVEDNEDDDGDRLLAIPLKGKKNIDYLEGMTAEMYGDDTDYLEGMTAEMFGDDTDYLEGMTAEMFGDDDEFERWYDGNSVPTSHGNVSQVEKEVEQNKVGRDKDDDDVNILATPLKDEEKYDYLEGITADMFGDDDESERWYDGHGDGVLTSSQENTRQIEREELELWEYEVEALGSSQEMEEPQGCVKDLSVEADRDLHRHTTHHHNVIQEDHTFSPQKKRYERYLMGDKDTVDAVRTIFEESGILLETNHKQQSVCQLVILMAQREPGERVRPEDVWQCVRKHRLFPQAEACLTIRFKNIHGAPSTFAAMALILLLSETVEDVQALVSHLQGAMTHRAITEFLYEMATFLLAMDRNGIWISNRLHYNIYHVLHLMRNSPTQIRTDHSRPQIHMTDEQHKILSHDISNNHVVKIIAFAGTGKTSTLVRYAEKWQDRRFLYVTFNRSVATAACFPKHVVCRTIHSLAFQAIDVGRKYEGKWSSNLKALYITKFLPKGRGGFANAKVVTLTLNAYMASADECINTSHVPETYKNNKGVIVNIDQEKKRDYMRVALDIWNKMKDPNEMRCFIPHDGYLKLWQLEKPCLDFDVILLDEAQDFTPVIMDILLSQCCGKILVGDPHQQIYSFRGAVNALHIVQHTHLYYLTQSFRFGAEIAYIGATILQVCKNVKEILVGGDQPGLFCDESTDPFVMPVQGKTAILARSNVGVFSEAVRLTDANLCCKIHFVGGIESTLSQILDIWHVMGTKPIGEGYIRHICRQASGFLGLKMYASETEDHELEAKLAIVEKYHTRFPELVYRLYRCFESDIHKADFILGTVHKAKGLEFDTVIITNDFDLVPCARHNLGRMNDFSWNRIPEDEWNLLYVAVTRARTSLIVNRTVCNILTQAGEYFLKPEMISSMMEEGQPPQCSIRECGNFIMTNSAFAMCKRPMRYMDSMDPGGPLCERCVWQRIGPTAFLQTDKIFNQPETQEQLKLETTRQLCISPHIKICGQSHNPISQ